MVGWLVSWLVTWEALDYVYNLSSYFLVTLTEWLTDFMPIKAAYFCLCYSIEYTILLLLHLMLRNECYLELVRNIWKHNKCSKTWLDCKSIYQILCVCVFFFFHKTFFTLHTMPFSHSHSHWHCEMKYTQEKIHRYIYVEMNKK